MSGHDQGYRKRDGAKLPRLQALFGAFSVWISVLGVFRFDMGLVDSTCKPWNPFQKKQNCLF